MAMASGMQNIIQEKIKKYAFQKKNVVRDVLVGIFWLIKH